MNNVIFEPSRFSNEFTTFISGSLRCKKTNDWNVLIKQDYNSLTNQQTTHSQHKWLNQDLDL